MLQTQEKTPILFAVNFFSVNNQVTRFWLMSSSAWFRNKFFLTPMEWWWWAMVVLRYTGANIQAPTNPTELHSLTDLFFQGPKFPWPSTASEFDEKTWPQKRIKKVIFTQRCCRTKTTKTALVLCNKLNEWLENGSKNGSWFARYVFPAIGTWEFSCTASHVSTDQLECVAARPLATNVCFVGFPTRSATRKQKSVFLFSKRGSKLTERNT